MESVLDRGEASREHGEAGFITGQGAWGSRFSHFSSDLGSQWAGWAGTWHGRSLTGS